MGVLVVIGLGLIVLACANRNGWLAIFAGMLCGVGVVGDGGGMGVFAIIGLAFGFAALVRRDLPFGLFAVAIIALGIIGDTQHWFIR